MRMDELRGAFPAMPDATRDALEITLCHLDDGERQGNPDRNDSPSCERRSRRIGHSGLIHVPRRARGLRLSVPALALILAIALAGAAVAAAYPQVLRWLVGPDEQPSADLESLAKALDISATEGDITARLTGYVTDGQELALSFELCNASPTRPAFVVLESVYMGEIDIQRWAPSIAYEMYWWCPKPYLDVLPVRRNPVVCGRKFWVGDIDASATGGKMPVTATLRVLRPARPFVLVDEIVHGGLAEYDEETRAEIQDVIDTLLSFDGTVVAKPGDMDPQMWLERGYIPITHHCDLPAGEETNNLLKLGELIEEEGALTLTFDVDLSGAVVALTPNLSVELGDCEAVLRSVSLSPMSTALVLDLIPDENAFEAAEALEKYGMLILCDADGNPLKYLSMDWIMTDRGYAQERDGRWICRYAFDMPGLAAFPEEIRLRLTGNKADPQALERFEEAMVFLVGLGEE